MLLQLTVKNYALIQELNLSFDKGLSVITGETGAGKSIILGALGLVTGDRADSSAIAGHESKCIVEAVFDIEPYHLNAFFETHDLDYSHHCTLRREISIQGKSRAFINDTPVGLNVLKDLGEALLDIHSQHETLSLKDRTYPIQLVDTFADNEVLMADYRKAFRMEKSLLAKIQLLEEQEAKWREEYDYHKFLLQELSSAHLVEGEQEEVEQELKQLEHAAEISAVAFEVAEALRNSDDSSYNKLSLMESRVRQQIQNTQLFEPLQGRLKSLLIEADDLAQEFQHIADSIQQDDLRLEQVKDRLDLIYALQKKHRVDNVGELLVKQAELAEKTAKVDSLEDEKLALNKEYNHWKDTLNKQVAALRLAREKSMPGLAHDLCKLLDEVGMPNARLEFKVEPLEHYTEDGPDMITLLFSSNPGSVLQPLNKVASGGELSRVMLCLKSILASKRALPTLIFDEIDTGISGEIAAKVGRMMKAMSVGHQVFSITHLPQMAAFGDAHYRVLKEVENGRTATKMLRLSAEERQNEIARMLSGDKITESALANARELMSK